MDHRLVEGMVPKVGLGYMDDGKKKGKKSEETSHQIKNEFIIFTIILKKIF
jgi:hypothetical protein